jgi:biotin carboxylase
MMENCDFMDIDQKTILVVGAGFGQLPLIMKARELGCRVICVDRDPNAPGMKIADDSFVVDVVDHEGIYLLAQQQKINGILTMQSDLPVPSVGYVNEKMGLIGVDYDTALVCSNKDLSRERFKCAGVSQPEYLIVDSSEEALNAVCEIGFPCVVKAADSSGSRGVTRVSNETEIDDAYKEARNYSRSGKVLVEQFISGIEIGAQTFSMGGKCEIVCLHNDSISSEPYMIPIGHSYPFIMDGVDKQRAIKEISKAVIALGIIDGPANVDLIVSDNGTPYMIEVGARIGATCLPELTSHYLGIDWVTMTIKLILGEIEQFDILGFNACAAYILESPNDGVLKEIIIPDWVNNHENLIEIEITAKLGEKVNKLRKGTDRIGKIFTCGKSVDEADEVALKIKQAIIFVVE